jgi:transposase
MRKTISIEQKLEAVKKVLEENMPIYAVAREMGFHKTSVAQWTKRYREHGMDGIEKKPRGKVYPGEFRLQVLRDISDNNLTYRDAAVKYNISSHPAIKRWEMILENEGEEGLMKDKRGKGKYSKPRGRTPNLGREEIKDVYKENERLRMEVDYLKKLNALVRDKEK